MSFRRMSNQLPSVPDIEKTNAPMAVEEEQDAFFEIHESTLTAVALSIGRFLLRALIIIAVLGALIFGFTVMERQPAISQTFGLTDLRLRAQALPDAVFWSFRKWKNNKAEHYSPIDMRYGYARDFINGQLIVHEYTKNGRIEKSYPLASIETYSNQHGAIRAWVRERRGAETRFDIYTNAKGVEHTVVWTRTGPWNVQLIALGYAYPSPNPPTNVVDAAFAEHYWQRVKGNVTETPHTHYEDD